MSTSLRPSVVRPVHALVPSQEDRELAEALGVQAMSDQQRGLWLESVWGKVQRNAAHFRTNALDHPPGARQFSTLEEKNRFDEARELAFAMEHSVFAVAMRAAQNEAARTCP